MVDKTTRSGGCGVDEDFSEKSQLFYEEKYFSDPLRCPGCKKIIKQIRPADSNHTGRK